jgi:hypothetical protein|tara:strand:- start:3006 stop:3350 length:345 start_codon:yes stop_codon:yes gene_type:complete
MIEELIDKTFKLRDAAHIAHWKTKSYSEHKALGHFYEDVIDDLDKLIEAYQGVFGIVEKIEGEKKDVASEIKDQILWINENRSNIAGNIPALENIVDELTALHMTTLYKLENLR